MEGFARLHLGAIVDSLAHRLLLWRDAPFPAAGALQKPILDSNFDTLRYSYVALTFLNRDPSAGRRLGVRR